MSIQHAAPMTTEDANIWLALICGTESTPRGPRVDCGAPGRYAGTVAALVERAAYEDGERAVAINRVAIRYKGIARTFAAIEASV